MRKRLLLSLYLLTVLSTAPAFAQDGDMVETPLLTLEQRYENCMDNEDCSAQERWKIIEEMTHKIRQIQQKMHDMCRSMDYKNDCLSMQEKEREQWHKMHSHMRDMMRSMEHRNFWEKIVN